MEDTSESKPENKYKKHISVGVLAHVDAGKTTLSEAMLYTSGSIRRLGRVDNQDAFLDTYAMERARGITIFSKQARMEFEGREITLLDTPGHVDFSAEMERTLQVLDYGVLVISGADGVQAHTETLWRLLSQKRIPVFLFINKMDQTGTDKNALLAELQTRLDSACVDFSDTGSEDFLEAAAMCGEEALEEYLNTGSLTEETIGSMVQERKLFPCFFGSALRLIGIHEFMEGISRFGVTRAYPDQFGARVYKIARDDQNNRLTYLKITGGSLRVKAVVSNRPEKEAEGPCEEVWEEKVNEIRIYSGEKYETVKEAEAGTVCAVTGLSKTFPGLGLGIEGGAVKPLLAPVLNFQVLLPEGCDPAAVLPKLKQLEEEEPELHVVWDEHLKEILVQLMGEVQIDILKNLIEERFHITADFGTGSIVYKETIKNTVEGVGHFEPLKHYAEVHLLLEPGEPGSGLLFSADLSEDKLDKNWQKLVLTHLEEKSHKGVLTGSPITDMKITLVAGKAHVKHTEGGDFRQATYRALRQGLMEGDCVLLEPWYEFRLEIPEKSLGRAMTDLEKMGGTFSVSQTEGTMPVLTGSVPAASMRGYQTEITAYTGGLGRISCSLAGYRPCHNADEVIEQIGYDPERDTENPAGSVFCSHGAGFVVPWDQVKQHMHVESPVVFPAQEAGSVQMKRPEPASEWIGTEEIDSILERTFYANKRGKEGRRKGYPARKREESVSAPVTRVYHKAERKEEYLLVDGYNIIFAWEELRELAELHLDSARGKLMDLLCNYQALRRINVIVVFDAYRLKGHGTEAFDYHNIHVIYTKEAETADQYIERFAHENGQKYEVSVATSDGLEQVIIRGQGCRLISAKELYEDMERLNRDLKEEHMEQPDLKKPKLFDGISGKTAEEIAKIKESGSGA